VPKSFEQLDGPPVQSASILQARRQTSSTQKVPLMQPALQLPRAHVVPLPGEQKGSSESSGVAPGLQSLAQPVPATTSQLGKQSPKSNGALVATEHARPVGQSEVALQC
jgi:hypothetical protein